MIWTLEGNAELRICSRRISWVGDGMRVSSLRVVRGRDCVSSCWDGESDGFRAKVLSSVEVRYES